jgi:beta-carotene ketolase (CrtO type)
MPSPAGHTSPGSTSPGRPAADADAIVVGAGHNGLITAAYLARAGMRTLVLEARDDVGGTAASEHFAGATVNICNCDHITFRTTPIIAELDLGRFGLQYLDVEPGSHHISWAGGPPWASYHDVEATLDSLAATYPDDVDGYRRYVRAAVPASRLILAAAAEPPTVSGLTRHAVRARLAGVPTILRWSRRSAADVLRSFFRHDAVQAPAAVVGPMVWGITPESPGSGLGALTYATRHVGRLGRPVGGSGMVPTSILRAFLHHGGELRTKSEVDTILCEDDAVRGVALVDGTEIIAPIVVSACDPHRTFLRWLRRPPAAAKDLVRRWQAIPHGDGYESKVDAVVGELPVLRRGPVSLGPTLVIAPTLGEMHRGHRLMDSGEVLDRPALLVNVPSILDPTMAPEDGATRRHVFSLEALYTPYGLRGGWPGSSEPWRWLERFAELCDPGFLDSIESWRAMTPDVYERDFHLPAGRATGFSGGVLAAFRNPNPELTSYETAVRGLYLTGAATFPGAGVWGLPGKNCATVVLAHHVAA